MNVGRLGNIHEGYAARYKQYSERRTYMEVEYQEI